MTRKRGKINASHSGERKCVACNKPYYYKRHGFYEGKSPRRCIECQLLYLKLLGQSAGTQGSRGPGHKTRQQHKHVYPTKED